MRPRRSTSRSATSSSLAPDSSRTRCRARVVRRLAVRGLSTLAMPGSLSTLAVPRCPPCPRAGHPARGLAALLRRAAANEALRWWGRARIGRGRCRPGLAVPVPEETLAAARIGIPPRVRTHGQSLCAEGVRPIWTKLVVTRRTACRSAQSDLPAALTSRRPAAAAGCPGRAARVREAVSGIVA